MSDDGVTIVLVPVLNRPHRVAPLLASIDAATPEPHRTLFIATDTDQPEIDALEQAGADWIAIPANFHGDYARKINAGYQRSTEEYLLTAADDLNFHSGWLPVALAKMADPAIGVVGTNDLGNARVMAGLHSTHSLVRRRYVDDLGTVDERRKVLHEGYWHEYVDDEFVQTAQHRKAFTTAVDSIVEHMHPNWGKAPSDPLYDMQRRRMAQGRRLYWRRQHLWGGNPCPM